MGRIRRIWRGREHRREEAHARHAAELVRRWRRWASAGRDGGAITMRGIEIAVDGSGGDGRRRRNGRQDGRAAAAGQGDGVSPSYLLDFNERDIEVEGILYLLLLYLKLQSQVTKVTAIYTG